MRHLKRILPRLALTGLLVSSTLSTGCFLLRDNVSLNFVIPLGFGGSPGIFNPFGVVQAIVNSLLGAALTTDGASSSGSAPSVSPGIDPGAIGVVVNRP